MPDFGKIQWETEAKQSETRLGEGAYTFHYFLNYCEAKLPSQNFVRSYDVFVAEKLRFQQELEKSIDVISKEPLLTAFLVWVKEVPLIPNFDLTLAKILLEKGFIGITDTEGHVWTIAKAKTFNHQDVLDAIRCHYEWSTDMREGLVMAYTSFIQWLSNATFGYIEKVEDPDLLRSNARAFPYPLFLKFISYLKDKDRLVAKLLYFGGTRTLEEVLDLKIENIDFEKRVIFYDLKSITYPLHVFADAKTIVKERKKGKVFLGRQNAPLNQATIFRNLKMAAIESGIGDSFTPKVLIINK